MIVVDTNVVSESVRLTPSSLVLRWFDEQDVSLLHLTSVSLAEIFLGIECMPAGARRERLTARMDQTLDDVFGLRILAFDERAARAYGRLAANARRSGRAVSIADGQIAAIAFVHGFAVATRDEAPFRAMGVSVINPWSAD